MGAITEHMPEAIILALGVAGLALLLVVIALEQTRRSNRKSQKQLQALERDLLLLQSGAVGMGQRIMAMESKKNSVSDISGNETSLKPYSEATHLLSLGVDRDEVANRCGLSRAEASLLDALRHKKS